MNRQNSYPAKAFYKSLYYEWLKIGDCKFNFIVYQNVLNKDRKIKGLLKFIIISKLN